MYIRIPAYEADHDGLEEVDPEDQCEDCGEKYQDCACGNVVEEDEYFDDPPDGRW